MSPIAGILFKKNVTLKIMTNSRTTEYLISRWKGWSLTGTGDGGEFAFLLILRCAEVWRKDYLQSLEKLKGR